MRWPASRPDAPRGSHEPRHARRAIPRALARCPARDCRPPLFWLAGTNFGTWGNLIELVRLAGEVGLLALALTPIIISGGIDLSVGAHDGPRRGRVRPRVARRRAAGVGGGGRGARDRRVAGGALNALLIARFSLPPLLVTLGTLSLFRGLAEGITGGADFVSGFPAGFLWIGQCDLRRRAAAGAHARGRRPSSSHTCCTGRFTGAAGTPSAGRRKAPGTRASRWRAGSRRSTCCRGSSPAALRFSTSRALGQAKADAGTGYELMAIAAVVLGGTSITGGRGTIGGTLLGVAGIVILQNGLRLADLPAELAGHSDGRAAARHDCRRPPSGCACDKTHVRASVPPQHETEPLEMRNSQLAVLCAVVLAAALIVAGSNWWTGALARAAASRRGRRTPAKWLGQRRPTRRPPARSRSR